jgi:predicted RNA-binding protein associated with RNAse of E/G family
MITGDWDLSPWVWRWNHVLRLMQPGSAHSVEVYWDAETWQLRSWYVNLQDPVRRTPEGFETTDHVLDIVVDPSGVWQWKDEDKLATLVDVGYYGDIDARRIRAEGLRVVEQIERWASPFCDGWESWRPSHIQQTSH